MKTIRRCPECGGDPFIMKLDNYWAVECSGCWFYSNRKFKTKEQAIDYWNSGAKNGYCLLRTRGEE